MQRHLACWCSQHITIGHFLYIYDLIHCFLENRLIAQFHSCTNKSLSLNQYQLQLKKWVTKKSETIYLIHETVRLFGLGFRISPIQLYNSWCTYQNLDTVVSSLFFCVLKMTMHRHVTLSGKRFSLNSIFILKFRVPYFLIMINWRYA